jgi:hypothetical protein
MDTTNTSPTFVLARRELVGLELLTVCDRHRTSVTERRDVDT